MIVTRSNAVTNIFVKIFGRLPPQLTTEVINSWRHLFSLTTVRYMSTSRLSLSLCTTHTVPASKPLAVTPSLDAKANENFYKWQISDQTGAVLDLGRTIEHKRRKNCKLYFCWWYVEFKYVRMRENPWVSLSSLQRILGQKLTILYVIKTSSQHVHDFLKERGISPTAKQGRAPVGYGGSITEQVGHIAHHLRGIWELLSKGPGSNFVHGYHQRCVPWLKKEDTCFVLDQEV